MRRNAFHLSGVLIGLIAFVVVSMSATAGRAADEERAPMLAAVAPIAPIAQPPVQPPELLHETAAPRKVVPAPAPSPRTLTMEVTAYCPCRKCCGPKARGITASGKRVSHNAGLFVAADTSVLPFHTQLRIPGYGQGTAVPVLDRGGAIKGHKLDVFFPSHQEAREWGRRMIEVTVVE